MARLSNTVSGGWRTSVTMSEVLLIRGGHRLFLTPQVVALRTAARADQEQSESLAQTVKVLLQQQSQVLSR